MATNTRTVILRRGEEEHAERILCRGCGIFLCQLVLAVNPRQMVLSQPHNTLSYQTIRGETVHASRGSGLMQVTLETFFPHEESRFYQGTEPQQALAMVSRWKAEGSPVRLLISDCEVDGLFLVCALERVFTEGDRDVGVRMVLKEYKYLSSDSVDPAGVQQTGGLWPRADERSAPTVYVTAGGEDLWTVARLCLGDGGRWKELAVRNGISDPHDLPAGKELYLS